MEKVQQEKITVDINNYENFWALLNSADKENSVVALTILNNANFRESLPYILLLFKSQDEASRATWLNNALDLKKKLEGIDINSNSNLSYKAIIDLVKDKCPIEAVQFTIDKFSLVLKKYLVEWGFDFVKDLDLVLKLKVEDGK